MRKKEKKLEPPDAQQQVKKKITNWLEFPKEVILDLPVISLIGQEELYLENYKGMIEYNDERMRISTSCGILKIEGRGLHLKVMTTENIVVTGTLLRIEYII
ncbi:MAG: sporulation protein YqfC [Epulopiscium sp.]|nr:sporulation protein YqfC [Candidatus Epulonipiscium sp.]